MTDRRFARQPLSLRIFLREDARGPALMTPRQLVEVRTWRASRMLRTMTVMVPGWVGLILFGLAGVFFCIVIVAVLRASAKDRQHAREREAGPVGTGIVLDVEDVSDRDSRRELFVTLRVTF